MMSVHKKTLGRVSGRWEHIFWVLAIITLAMVVRIALIAQGWPLLDSDEGTMGLMAMHVAYRGEFPVFFYGQAYMGATEAYLGAFFFHLFGVSAFTLRLGLIIIFVVFLIAMYALTALLYGRMLALITLLILALGSNAVLTRELAAVGGDPETLMSGALLMALATWLALTSNPQLPQRRQWRRILLYGLWGLVAGFSLFSHVLGAPFIALSAIILLLFCWRELLGWATAWILAGAFISLSPLIYYNLTETTGKSTWFYVRHAMSAGNAPVHIWQQIKGALLISLPTATGAHPLCAVSSVHAVRLNSLNGIHCTLVHTSWSLGWLFLWTMAALGACGALWQLLRRHPHSWSLEDRQQAVRQWGRLSLLTIGGGTLFLYVVSPNSALYPVATSRYLIGLLIVTPALLYPLWQGLLVLKPLLVFISSRFFLSSRVEHDSMVIGRVILSGVVLIFAFGTFSTFTGIPPAPVANAVNNVYFTQNSTRHLDVPATWALNQRESNLIQRLLGMHVHSIYSDYWTCDRLIFQSREQLICSVITDNLRSGHDRYPLYPALVRADHGATYVLLQNSQADSNFARGIKTHVITIPYQRFVFDGYSVYVPVRHPAPTSNAL